MICIRKCTLIMLAVVAAAGCGGCNEIAAVFPRESGFDGAVALLDAEENDGCYVFSVRIPYLDIYGKEKNGLARLVIRKDNAAENAAACPAFCHVHYELSVDGAKRWADQGWAVFSAVYNDKHPIDVSPGDGNNLARAVIQWARRCPLVNPAYLHLDGGSQGGYMALAMSADLFPTTSATADVPVVNWAYNFGYFEANRALSAGYEDPFASPLPILAAVTSLADMSYQHFTSNLADDAWFWLSPISMIERITNPVMILCATGDMLVPIEQMTRTDFHPQDPARFPAGYVRDFNTLTHNDRARMTLEELLPAGQVFKHIEPLQENAYIVTLAMRQGKEPHPETKPAPLDRVWSEDHQWNLYYLNEGPPEPYADHFTYAWNTHPGSFVAHYQQAVPATGQLNAAKLRFLLDRYANAMNVGATLKDGAALNRRNFDHIERRDVVSGLLAFASYSPDHESHLAALYAQSATKPLGDAVNRSLLAELLDEILSEAKP